MRPGYGKSFHRLTLRATWPGCSSVCAPRSSGKIASVVETLKLIIPQQDAPARRLIGFRNGVLDTATGTFNPHHKSHWLRTLCDVDFTPGGR